MPLATVIALEQNFSEIKVTPHNITQHRGEADMTMLAECCIQWHCTAWKCKTERFSYLNRIAENVEVWHAAVEMHRIPLIIYNAGYTLCILKSHFLCVLSGTLCFAW